MTEYAWGPDGSNGDKLMTKRAPFGRDTLHAAYQRSTGKPLSPRERKGLESVLNELTFVTATTHPIPKLPPVHTSSTQRPRTEVLWLVTAVAIVAGVVGVMFGTLIHP